MPTVSAAQHRAMEAAAHGHSTLGIPQSVGQEFVEADKSNDGFDTVTEALEGLAGDESEEDREGEKSEPQVHDSAGIVFVAPNGRVLFLKRDALANKGGMWDWPGGHLEPGETLVQGAIREAHEESGYLAPEDKVREMSRAITEDVDFTTFICPVDEMFTPDLSRDEFGHREHDDWRWADPRDPPEPLHPGIEDVLSNPMIEEIIKKGDVDPREVAAAAEDEAKWAKITAAMDAMRSVLALDRASVRSYDADGRLHVALTPISAEMVCPYLGAEIPNCEELGLDPHRIYRLLRPGDELEKGAASSNGLPLLREHQPTDAEDHPSEIVIGSLGTDAIFQDGFLWNSMTVWVAEDIEGIESGEKYQISASYRYVMEPSPGTWKGEPYDGVMRGPPDGPGGLVFNHAAIVVDGRCGVRVSVADAMGDDVRWALVEEAVRGFTT